MSNLYINRESQFQQCGGAELMISKAIFTRDSKFVCCCCGDVVKIISVKSGECVQELIGHKGGVLSVTCSPVNSLRVFTTSLDCSIKQWDYQDGVELKTYRTSEPVYQMFIINEPSLTYIASTKTRVVRLKQSRNRFDMEEIVNNISENSKNLSIGCNNQVLVSYNSRFLICHSLTTNLTKHHPIPRTKHESLTCIQCHPTKECVATGGISGKIYFWWNVLEDDVISTIYHWHHLAINDLEYITDGSYILSGGHECVLVKWQNGTDDKDFLSRLEAPITHISSSPDNNLYCLTHADNAIQIVSSSFELSNQYQGLTRAYLPHQFQNYLPTGLLVDPRSGTLVLSGRPGHLQFYDPVHDKQLYNMDITGENYVVVNESKGLLSCTEVTRAAFSMFGDILATVEVWDDRVMSPEIRLKLWHDAEGTGSFVLNTCVELPHNKPINSILFRPMKLSHSGCQLFSMLVTTSDDGKFKLWELVDDTDLHGHNTKWDCRSVGFYRNHAATAADFSFDGSVLAVVFHSTITLWNPDSNALKTVLEDGSAEFVRNVSFGQKTSSQLLLSQTRKHMSVWNLLTCSIEWSVSVEVTVLAVDPSSDRVAVFTPDRKAHIFSLKDPGAKCTFKVNDDVAAAVFKPNDQLKMSATDNPEELSSLYVMCTSQKLYRLDNRVQEQSRSQHSSISIGNLSTTPMSLLLTANRKSDVKDDYTFEGSALNMKKTTRKSTEFFPDVSHTAAPVSQICRSFLTNLLQENIQVKPMDSYQITDENSPMTAADKDHVTAELNGNASKSLDVACNSISLDLVLSQNYDWSCIFE